MVCIPNKKMLVQVLALVPSTIAEYFEVVGSKVTQPKKWSFKVIINLSYLGQLLRSSSHNYNFDIFIKNYKRRM
jgi:hypothetical protein